MEYKRLTKIGDKRTTRFGAMVFLLLALVIGAAAAVTPPLEEWSKTYGDPSQAYSVLQTSDGGYAFAGYNYPNGTPEFWLVKTDSSGTEQWSKMFVEPLRTIDKAYSVQQTSDGGYILAGATNDTGRLVKTDSLGNEEWNKTYGGSRPSAIAYSVLQTHDGGYIFVGRIDAPPNPYYVTYDAWVVKTDSLGNEQWSKIFPSGLGSLQQFRSVQQISGGYILAGSSYPGRQAWLVKINSTGAMIWEEKFAYGLYNDAYAVRQTQDGGYVLVGTSYTWNPGMYSDAWLVKTNSSGGEQWHNIYGEGYIGEDAHSFWPTSDGGYIIAGSKANSSGSNNHDGWLVKTYSSGGEQWNRTYGAGSIMNSIQQTSDKGYIIAGIQDGHGWLLKLSNSTHIVNITFLSPLENGMQYNATGNLLPIRFMARNASGVFSYDESASVNITDVSGTPIANFGIGNGLSVNMSNERYDANFNASNYPEFASGDVYNIAATLSNESGPTGSASASFMMNLSLPEIRYINGTVIDSVAKIGISGVNVSTNTSNSTVTNATGFYSLAIRSGFYNLTARLDPTYYMNSSVSVSTAKKVMVKQDIVLVKKPTGNITGTVGS